jgi:uncharacterized protein YndB with AHSA1/START domain
MPRVTRSKTIHAPLEDVWGLLADPYHLPRWWPRVERVEDVHVSGDSGRARWTSVMKTEAGAVVRADFRRVSAAEPSRLIWEQETEGTPFERIMHHSRVEVMLDRAGGETRVKLTANQRLRGLSRLGGGMMRRGTARTLDEALDGLEQALGGGSPSSAAPARRADP